LRAEFGESRYDREGQCLSKKTNGWLEPGLQATTIGSQIIYHAIALPVSTGLNQASLKIE
jgi:hypothetical protein